MKQHVIAAGIVLAVAALTASAQDSATDQQLLTAFDEARFLDDEVNVLRIRIVTVTPDEQREAVLQLLFDDTDGTRSRIEFIAPEELAGQLYLNTPDATYFFGPDLDFPIKTSASAEVFGDAAVAQTTGIRFAEDYTVTERRTVTTDEGSERLEVDLEAVDRGVAFQQATVFADPGSLRPISTVLYALSGEPLYDVFYESYATRDEDDLYVVTQRIVDRTRADRETITEIVDFAIEPFDPELFDPDALGTGEGT